MSTLSSANVTDVNLVLKKRTHMRLCINMLIFMHNLGNWLMVVFHKLCRTAWSSGVWETESVSLSRSSHAVRSSKYKHIRIYVSLFNLLHQLVS